MTITTTQLDGWFKRVYADKLSNVVPSWAILRNDFAFEKSAKQGDSYNFPVKLTRSHGITWAGGSTAGTAFALNSAISMLTKNATVSGSEFVLRENIAYGAVSRSGTGNNESFGSLMTEVPLDMTESANFYLESALLYGGTSIGTINADPGGGGAVTRDIVITTASWAAGLWTQMEGAAIDIWDPTFATQRTNSATPCLVTAVNADTRTVSLSGDGGDLDDIAANDVVVPKGASTNWFSGLDKICTNAGSLFGISAATYNLWKASSYSASSAPLTMGKIQNAISAAVVRGLIGDVKVIMSPYTWTDLNNDAASLRRFSDSTRSEADIGTNKLTFYGVNGGKLELESHPMVKAGEAFIYQPKNFVRIGSSDVTFGLKGVEDRFFLELPDNAGFQLRNYFDQGLICKTPAKNVKITNIVNASL